MDRTAYRKKNLDSVVSSIISKFVERAEMGKKKYGIDLDRDDLKVLDYLEKFKRELCKKND